MAEISFFLRLTRVQARWPMYPVGKGKSALRPDRNSSDAYQMLISLRICRRKRQLKL
jgi:hypothetical protein